MKEVVGFPMYTLDEQGNVYSKYVKGGCGSHSNTLRKLTPVLDKTGYLIVSLIDREGAKIKVSIHRLVAIAYLPNPDNKKHVNHKDGCKTNNHLDNLEWCTPLENTLHAIATGLKDTRNLSQCVRVGKFSLDGGLLEEFDSLKKAELSTGVPFPNISKVCKGVRKHAGGFIWKYL